MGRMPPEGQTQEEGPFLSETFISPDGRLIDVGFFVYICRYLMKRRVKSESSVYHFPEDMKVLGEFSAKGQQET